MKEFDLNQVWYVCPFASYITKKKDSLKTHIARMHGVSIKASQNICNSKEAAKLARKALKQAFYVCFLCDSFGVKEKEDLLHHLTHDHAIIVGLYECPYCDYKSEHKNLVQNHIWSTHMIKIKDLGGNYGCPNCDYKSEDKNLVHNHIRNKHIKPVKVLWENHKCPFCDFKTEKVDDLSHHLDVTH